MEDKTDKEVCMELSKLYDETENSIKTEAKVKRAYIDKVSEDVIQEKVDNELNLIKNEIHRINPKFNENSKDFDKTKALVSETLANYEEALISLSAFYDEKIQKLILKKVELEASLIGAILNEEYLYGLILDAENLQKDDKVKSSVKENIKFTINKLLSRKKEKKVADPQLISKLMDSQDIILDLENTTVGKLEETTEEKIKNKETIAGIEEEILSVCDEIERINERKKKSIYDAMELGENSLTTNINKKRKIFSRIVTFFTSRINTSKVIESNVVDPLKLRIESFKNNELANIQ